ncbi:PREDICTED: HEAT repeat-containing protein 1-like [Priapulus caudatus]|uniref:HEAT repeat-containing protein 1 n=1 Tax=Priapulus caudatus TaxID=37621 RepID=A0ABM1DN72_PRICU|nr:PREDICTED: HEAT repeat-containing protein 1-like [Priapulus caudatus]
MTETLVKNISLPEEFKSKVWWCTMADEHLSLQKSVSMVIKLYSFLTTHASEGHHVAEFRELSQMFFKDHFGGKTMLLSFLGNIWASGAPYSETPAVQEITPIMKIRALHIGKVALEMATKNDVLTALSISSDVLPSLLVALASPLQPIRSCTLQCLQTVNSVCKDDNYTNSVLIKALCERAEEIIADRNYLPQLFRDLFSNDVASPQKRRKSVSKSKMGSKVLEGIVLCASSEETSDFVQEKLLWCLSELNSNEVLLLLQPPLARLVALARDDSASMSRHQVASLQFILRKFTELTAGILSVELELFQLFQQALLTPRRPQADMLSPQAMAFAQLTKLAFAAMSPAAQQTLLATLIDLLVDGTDADVVDDVRRALKTIALDAPRLVAEIDKLLRLYATEGATIRKPRSARVTRAAAERGDAVAMETETSESTTPLIDDRPWRRVILILEVMHQKKKIRNIQLLVPCLFTLLGRCLEMEVTPSSEYVKQLLLSCVQHACTRLSPDHAPVDATTLAPRQFNVELVVACIRGSANPLTHQHALMLLTVAAQMFPVHVLHNIMSIFTFMGANLLRQDDSYSFQVISNTVKTVIPAMVKASEESQSEEECSDMIVSIVQVFVDAFPHIPAHRRLPLFTELINTVGSRRHLWTVLALLFELHVTKTAADVPEWHEKTSLHPDLEFCLELCAAFPPSTQASAMRSLFAHMQALPQEKSDDPHGNQQTPVRKTPAKRQKVIRGMKESTKQLFHVSQHTSKELRHFKFVSIHFATLLLSCPAFVAQVVNLSDVGAEAMKPVYQLLLEETLRAIYQLARKADTATQKPVGKFHKALLHKAYDVLEKVNSLLPSEAFLSVIQGLMGNERLSIRRKALELLNSRLHSQLYQQQAFFKQEQVPVLLALVPELLAVAQEQDSGQEMAVNKQTALFSLKLLCRALGDEHPDTFKKVLHAVIAIVTEAGLNAAVLASALLCLAELCSCLKAHTISSLSVMMPKLLNVLSDAEQLASNDLLMLSSVTCLHKIVESVPNFLSPYMEEIIFRVSWLSSSEHGVNTHEAHLHIRLKALRHNLATTVAPRVLVPAITQGYTKLISTGKKAIGFLMSILSERLSSMSKDELTGHHQQIVSLFMNVLDFRTQHPTRIHLYDWATRPETPKEQGTDFLQTDEAYFDEDEMMQVSRRVLFCWVSSSPAYNSCFLYDTQGFVNKERIRSLYCIHSLTSWRISAVEKRCDHDQEVELKLLVFRWRLGALKVVNNSQHKLGEEYMNLLPETLPFLGRTYGRHNLATTVAPRVLVPAITQGYTKLTSTGKKAIGFLMSILSERLSSMSKDELTGHHQQIVSLFMNVLDFRTQHPTESTDVIMEVEGHVIEAILAMVMKMSEQTFRPMFYKLYDWATRPETPKDRVLTFYRLVASIADKLKGLFVLFAGHLVTNAATLLATNNSINTDEAYFDEDEDDASEQKSVVLLGFILSCLHSCFLYDTQGFVNKERFEALLHPLADQLENLCGGEELYNARVEEHLVPCLVQFAVAASDDSLWKQLNYQVLWKSRHASATVRLGALKVVEQFTHKLGEEYMNLLPETLPFLAELMEDESLEVERYCQDVVQLMEKVLGEPLQKYF